MENDKRGLKIKMILLGIIICASIFVALNFKKWVAGPRIDIEVSITDLYFRPAECGDGRTLYINLTIKNNRNLTNTWICLPYVITNKGKKHECVFDSSIEIPPYGVINVTAHTYDSESVCDPLSTDEIPQKFGYHIDIGDIFQPLAFEIDIPKDLVAKVSTEET